MTKLTIRCEICDRDKYITFTYLENLSNNGYNDKVLICPNCFAFKIMHELLMEKQK